MTHSSFDLACLFSAVEQKRSEQELSWAAMSRSVGIAASTMRRYATADDAEADGVLAAIRWLDAIPESYLRGDKGVGAALPASGDGYVRVDMDAVAAALGDNRGANGRTRTTIQNLVAAAHTAQQPIATLTRISEI